jgi:hypothetical protein
MLDKIIKQFNNFSLFKQKINNKDIILVDIPIINTIRVFSGLSLGVLSLISLCHLYITNKIHLITATYHYIGIYLTIDTLFAKNEFIFHHLLVSQLYLLNIYYKVPISNVICLLKFLMMTEISTIFLATRNIFLQLNDYFEDFKYYSTVKFINDICFILTFLITRIVNYYLFIIKGNILKNIIIMHYENSYISNYIIYTSFYGIFMINLYWFGLILEKICCIIRKKK